MESTGRRPTPPSTASTYYSKVGGSGFDRSGNPSTNYNDVTRRRVLNTNTFEYDFETDFSDNHHLNVLLGQGASSPKAAGRSTHGSTVCRFYIPPASRRDSWVQAPAPAPPEHLELCDR